MTLQSHAQALLNSVTQRLAAAGICLQITPKRVKNINFRLKPYLLMVSVPVHLPSHQVAQAIDSRIPWALNHHAQVVAQYKRQQAQLNAASTEFRPVVLWGIPQSFTLNHDKKIMYYRQALTAKLPELLDKWQPMVGAWACDVRIKKMHTRWGSCNTRARRVWLSVYLPAYPIECTEYVMVHELCHLHHANHSRAFWQTVAAAMPDYRYWHDMLAGNGKLD